MTVFFTIYEKLPSLNDVINRNRSNRFAGAKLKKDIEEIISVHIRKALKNGELKPVTAPCTVKIDWYEKNKRRDVDNIQSSQKFILDALVETGVLPDDGRKYVTQICHKIYDSDDYKICVTIDESI